jgi:hypothetical protein
MSPLQFSVLLVALAIGFAVLAVVIVRLARSLVERSQTGHSIPTDTEVTSDSPTASSPPLARVGPESHVVFGNRENPSIDVSICSLLPVETKRLTLPIGTQQVASDWLIKLANLYGLSSGVRTLEIRFSSEVARELAKGNLELMRSAIGNRPLAVNPNNGRVREIATLANGVNPVAAATFAWQILAFATAQKYLADINKRLANIEHDVGDIRQFLFDNHESELVASYGYLRQVTSAIAAGKLSFEDVIIIGSQLEDIERQCSRVMEHSYRGCQRTIDETKAEHSKKLHNLESFIQYSQKRGDKFRQYGRMSLLALSVRIVATYLRATLPLDKMIAHNRVEHLRQSVEEFDSFRRSFALKLWNTCDTMDAVFRFEATIEASKCLAKSKIASVDDMLAQKQVELERAIAYVEQRLSQGSGLETPLRWYAQIDSENKVTLSHANVPSEAAAHSAGEV